MINAKRIAERVLAAFRSCFFSLVDFLPLAPTQTEIPDFVHDMSTQLQGGNNTIFDGELGQLPFVCVGTQHVMGMCHCAPTP